MAEVALNVRLNDKEARSSLQSLISEIRKVETSGITLNINPQTASNVNAISQAFQKLSSTDVFRSFQAVGQAIDHVNQQIQHNRAVLQEQIALYGRYSDQASGVRTTLSDLGRELANLQRNHSEYEKRLQNTGAYNTFINETRKATEEAERLASAQAAVVRYVQGLNAGSKLSLARYGIDLSTGSSGIPGGGYMSAVPPVSSSSDNYAKALNDYASGMRTATLTLVSAAASFAADLVDSGERLIQFTTNLPGVSELSSITNSLLGMPGQGITSSISSGFSTSVERYDILRSFPRVMESIGFSAIESATATERLRDSILGLPIALDEVTEKAQYFTLLTGDLEKATDLTIALNNAFIASGSSQEQISTGTRVFTYLLEGATLTTRQWFSLIRSMPVGLKYVGEALGYSGLPEFTKDLRQGNIELDKFVDTLIDVGLNSKELNSILDVFKNRLSAAMTNLGIAAQRMGESLLTGLNDALGGDAYGLTGAVKEFARVLDSIGASGAQWIRDHGSEIRELVDDFIHYDWKSFVDGALSGFLDKLQTGLEYIQSISGILKGDLFGSLLTGADSLISRLDIIGGGLSIISSIFRFAAGGSFIRNFRNTANSLGAAFAEATGGTYVAPVFGGGAFSKFGSGIKSFLSTPVGGIENAFTSGATTIGTVIGSIVAPALATAVVSGLALYATTPQSSFTQYDILDRVRSGKFDAPSSFLGSNYSETMSNILSYLDTIDAARSQLVPGALGESTRILLDEKSNKIGSNIQSLIRYIDEIDLSSLTPDAIESMDTFFVGINDYIRNGVDLTDEQTELFNDQFKSIETGLRNIDRLRSWQDELVSRNEEIQARLDELYAKIPKAPSLADLESAYESGTYESGVTGTKSGDFVFGTNTRGKFIENWAEPFTEDYISQYDRLNSLIQEKYAGDQESIDKYTEALNKLFEDHSEVTEENIQWINGLKIDDDEAFFKMQEQLEKIDSLAKDRMNAVFQGAIDKLEAEKAENETTIEAIDSTQQYVFDSIETNLEKAVDDFLETTTVPEMFGRIYTLINSELAPSNHSSDISAGARLFGKALDSLRSLMESEIQSRNWNFTIPYTATPRSGAIDNFTLQNWRAASGGETPSFGTDTVPAMLTPGEYVHRRSVVQHYGKAFMDRLNNLDLQGALATLSMGYVVPFATGGLVRSDNRTYRDNHASIVQNFNNSRSDYSFRRANRFVRGLA